jgi:hypothetical protein
MLKKMVPVLFIVAAPLALADGKKSIQAGQWEITTQFEMEGSNFQVPPKTIQRCVTPEEAANPGQLVKPSKEHSGECTVKEDKRDGNTITMSFDCAGKAKGTGTYTFEASKWSGTTKMELMDKSGAMQRVKTTSTGRRLGDCK